jgi:Holliday junction DNA helicase RuvA
MDVLVSVPASSRFQPTAGDEVALHTHLHVREDQLALYGFSSTDELEIFELLLSVSGVGPKLALGMLAALPPNAIRRAIAAEDAHTLARAPGVGARAAARIIAELKTRMGPDTAGLGDGAEDGLSAAIMALVSMGYSPVEARRATENSPTNATIEDVIRHALVSLADRK